MLKIRKFIRYGVLAGAVAGTMVILEKNDWDITTVGLVRFGRAAFTIANIVLDYKMTLTMDPDSREYEKTKSEIHWRSAKKLLDMCSANGGVFIKVGQHVGSLEYLLPYEYVETLRVLHSSAPKSPFKDILRVVEEELNNKPDKIFTSFEEEPLGTASLAQVHKATLRDGTVVAVKVQHPQVLRHSFVDMKTMEFLVNVVAVLFPHFKFMWLAEETKKNLPIELRFLNEGQNAERIGRIFSKFPWFKVPKIYWDFSSNRVLTMEYCKGGQINDHDYMKQHRIDTHKVSHRLGLLYNKMIFVEGYVHCDPHPGNIFVQASAKHGPIIVLLDHGLYQDLSEDFRHKYCNLWTSLLNADVDKIRESAEALGVKERFGLLSAMVTARSWTAVTQGIQKSKVTKTETEQIRANAAKYLYQITEVLEDIPREMILILKTNDLLRGIEYSLRRQPGTAFIPMTKFCLRASFLQDIQKCRGNLFCEWRIKLKYSWIRIRIGLYDLVLKIINLFPFSLLRLETI